MADDVKITVEKDGPYVVEGGIPLVRKTPIMSEHGEPLTWQKHETLTSRGRYSLFPAEGRASLRTPSCRAMVTAVAIPRALNDPVGLVDSSLTHRHSTPSARPRKRAGRSGVIPSPRLSGRSDPGSTSA